MLNMMLKIFMKQIKVLQRKGPFQSQSIPATLVADISACSQRYISRRRLATFQTNLFTISYAAQNSSVFAIPSMDAIVYQLAAAETIYISVR